MSEKTEFYTNLALGVQKNLPELVSILNKAINHISAGQQQDILDRWIKQKFVSTIDYYLLYTIVAVAILLLAIFAFWVRRLSHEINLRTTTERELKVAQEILRISHQRLLLHREQTPLAVIEWDTEFKFVDWNKAAEKIFGYTKEEVVGRHVTERILPEDVREAVDSIWQDLLLNKGGKRSTNENITSDGRIILCEWYNTPLVDQDGKVIGVTSQVDDVTERKISEQMIWRQANFDALTGLPNRTMFHDRLTHEVKKSNRANLPLALLLIDLDEFKEVNDALGHDVGDLLLKEAGRRISDCVRESDTVARLGGDEFTVILSELKQKSKLDHILDKIISSLAVEYHLGDEVLHVSGSIGITLYPDDTTDIDSLIKNADQAMYEAKKKGKNCFSYFTQSLQEAAQNRLRLTSDLRVALMENQFELYFQPIIDLTTKKIIKAEALLRWHHPERGMISPLEFIPLTENSGQIYVIGDWVFRESVRWASHWANKFGANFQVTVNMSPVQFKVGNKAFTKQWQDCLDEFSISGSNIAIEITEGLLLDANPEVIDKLLWLRDAGIQVAIDDFGTGYSSLSYLKKFHIDYLKIDQAFIRNLEIDTNDMALSEAIIMMAHKLGLEVIAEGVENEEQKNLLTAAGCDYAQGFLYSKPLPAAELELILQNQQVNIFQQ
ncbi:MAG: EAL domain-containing protein [Gammaproteobacteria bacterium]|nr:EAL domain-containing protein [Gammaproteobacteria bacterium]MDX2487299.1 EAL domain-containing protein [Gammaproteobacteria bacterium]